MRISKKYIQMPNNLKVLGIDPGYERLGMAVIEKKETGKEFLVFSDCVKTSNKEEHWNRLYKIDLALEECIKRDQPEVLAIETLFFNTNQKTAIKVAEVRGVIMSTAAKYGMKVKEFNPLQVKQAITGYGRSEKRQVIATLPYIIKIDKKIKYDDEFDAIAVALACSATLSSLRI